MLSPDELQQKGHIELGAMMNRWEFKMGEVNRELHTFKMGILALNKEVNAIEAKKLILMEQARETAQKRNELEAEHRIIKTTYFNKRDAGE